MINRYSCFRFYMITVTLFTVGLLRGAETSYRVSPGPDNSFEHVVIYKGRPVLNLGLVGWGPGWGWVPSPNSTEKAKPGEPLKISAPLKIKNSVINVALDARAAADQSLVLKYDLTAEKDTPLTLLALSINATNNVPAVTITLTDNGKDSVYSYPIAYSLNARNVSKIVFHLPSGDILATFEPSIAVGADGALRVKLAADTCKGGTTSEKITLIFPQPFTYAATNEAVNQFVSEPGQSWFEWTPADFSSPSVIGMEDWLERPAGKHGGVRMVEDHFELEDGTRIKFWGTNLSYTDCAPKKEDAEAVAARFAKLGVNAVRLHKFCNSGWEGIGDPKDATKFTQSGLDQLDYMTSRLSSRGIYFGFSHSFGLKVREANKGRLLAYDEIVKALDGNTYSLINFAEDLQDVMIEMVVNLLKHKNAYTGKIYADDPALAWIELQNEDDIFFNTTGAVFAKCPTYANRLIEEFSEWLKIRYGSQEKLSEAWGDALQIREKLEARNIHVETNIWFLSDDNIVKKPARGIQTRSGVVPGNQDGALRRLMDQCLFFHEKQNAFYSKFIKAIRDAGYRGPIEGSPWQASSSIPHYYNLRSDYLAGFIDRHNYGNNEFNGTELRAGLGFFSTGLQQVIDRPFALSEWINVFPCHYQAEAPAMVAVYGLGLQGWDASFEFTSRAKAGFNDGVGTPPYGIWQVDTPANMGQFPTLARMIYRGDIKEADVISIRKVSSEDLEKGHLSFSDKVLQNGDVKNFTGSLAPEAMLMGRCVVQFTDKPEIFTFPDLTHYQEGSVITSSTKQLTWDASTPENCSFTVNTPGTKAIVGFAEGKVASLGDVTLTSHGPYISLFLTALEKTATLDNAKSALISLISRNTTLGLKISTIDNRVLNTGRGSFVLEPVKADVAIKGRVISAVNILNADGKRTNKTVPVNDGLIQLDTGRDKTMYYEVIFK